MKSRNTKFADELVEWLIEYGYTHCFFVPGGNSMHLLDGARTRMLCVPFVHEMSATIAAEYFNESNRQGKAFVLLTAGPGLTHAVSGISGAYLEGRELLVIGGQVKSSDLANGELRQRGIQEIDGVSIVKSITKLSVRIETPISKQLFTQYLSEQHREKPGPIFLEVCLDAQGASPVFTDVETTQDMAVLGVTQTEISQACEYVRGQLSESERPIILLGGGLPREYELISRIVNSLGLPCMTTYNGADRFGSNEHLYFGRPNTWGMRYSNVLISQADLVIAVGTRLGLQQTGFNYEGFAPLARIIQIDIDPSETAKSHPAISAGYNIDAFKFLEGLSSEAVWTDKKDWIGFCQEVKELLPLSESVNSSHVGYWNPYEFLQELSELATSSDLIIPCSSGGSFTSFYQAFENKTGQTIISNKSLASMGYGLAGAIGAAIANPSKRVLHIEGDGGFSQNLQELATVSVRKPNLKMFLMCNNGYASIRMTQKNYFGGNYLGCDTESGLGFPNWSDLAHAYGIGITRVTPGCLTDPEVNRFLESSDPHIFLIDLHPEQSFLPKISSRINEAGSMESEPLYEISPHLPSEVSNKVFKHFNSESENT
jgi:acetolactate synthase-1/2/3 large subunit